MDLPRLGVSGDGEAAFGVVAAVWAVPRRRRGLRGLVFGQR